VLVLPEKEGRGLIDCKVVAVPTCDNVAAVDGVGTGDVEELAVRTVLSEGH
jgi:hypothetical protein